MNEKAIMPRVKDLLAEQDVVDQLRIGNRQPRWVKIPDAPYRKMMDGGGKGFIPFKGTDLVMVKDCCEVKVVKAKTAQGMVFRPYKALRQKQDEHLLEHGGLLAVGFIASGKPDRLALLALVRWAMLSAALEKFKFSREDATTSLFALEQMAGDIPSDCYTRRYSGYARIVWKD